MRLALLILENRIKILIAIGLLTGFFVTGFLRLGIDEDPERMLFQNDPEYPVLQSFFQDFGLDEVVIVPWMTDRDLLNAHDVTTIKKITEKLQNIEYVDTVVSLATVKDLDNETNTLGGIVELAYPSTDEKRSKLHRLLNDNPIYKSVVLSEDSTVTFFEITLNDEIKKSQKSLVNAAESIKQVFLDYLPRDEFSMTGSFIVRIEMYEAVKRDLSTLAPVSAIIIALATFLCFQSPVIAVVLTLSVITLSSIWTFGIIGWLGYRIHFVSVLIPSMLFIIGTSDCVHILSRYQDCRGLCHTKKEALLETIRSMLSPCFLTSLTTAVGYLSLGAIKMDALAQFGVFTAVGIFIAFILSITMIPATLALLNTRSLTIGDNFETRAIYKRLPSLDVVLERLHNFNMKHRGTIIVVAIVLIGVCSLGLKRLHFESDAFKYFAGAFKGTYVGTQEEMNQALEKVDGLIPVFVVVETNGDKLSVLDPSVLEKINESERKIRNLADVGYVIGVPDILKHGKYRYSNNSEEEVGLPSSRDEAEQLFLVSEMLFNGDELRHLINDDRTKTVIAIRFSKHDFNSYNTLFTSLNRVISETFGDEQAQAENGLNAYITGTVKMYANTFYPIKEGMKASFYLALTGIFCIVVILFRSLRIAIVAMIPNLLPVVIILGTMGLFGIPMNLACAPMAAIAIGLAVDDTLHFIAWFKYERKNGKYNQAIRNTVKHVGKPIIKTSFVLGVGFCSFILSKFQFSQTLGLLISATAVIALFADLVVLPALLSFFKPLKGRHQI